LPGSSLGAAQARGSLVKLSFSRFFFAFAWQAVPGFVRRRPKAFVFLCEPKARRLLFILPTYFS
jgi:hypothetical protein